MDTSKGTSTAATPTTNQPTAAAPTANQPTAATPAPAHHFNLSSFLQILLALAPAIAAPFVPAGRATEVFAQEVPIAQAVGQAITQSRE